MKFATKLIRHYPPHLRHVDALLWEIKNSNFCTCGRKRKQIAFLVASNFVDHPKILIFLVFKIAILSPILIANKIFHVIFLLLIYFCDQFVTPEIRHCKCHW